MKATIMVTVVTEDRQQAYREKTVEVEIPEGTENPAEHVLGTMFKEEEPKTA